MPRTYEETTAFTIRLPVRTKVRLHEWAAERELTFTELLLRGAELYAGFSDGFLDGIRKIGAELAIEDLSIVLQQLLVAYSNTERADIDVFKCKSKTFARAFQNDQHGLIKGDRHAEIVYEQRKADNVNLLERFKADAKSKKPTAISREEAAILAAVR